MTHGLRRSAFESATVAAAGYLIVTIAMTWPLARGLTRDIPWDLGDSLLVCWILGWDADHFLRFLTGEFSALGGFWNANIFYPEPLTLAYSEHFVAQAIQILPVYAATRNLILCYNVLFLSTFVLSGLGTFLLVRELTGSPRAAFVAGLMYAFAPYRIGQFSHLQVISSQWMPFVLFGLRRYFDTGRLLPLAGAALALVAQNLSCGYYLVYFSPFVAAYVVYEIVDRGRVRDIRLWGVFAAVAVVVVGATWPFLQPYLAMRERGFARSLGEIEFYSADVYSYVTANIAQRVWGPILQVFPKPEGDLFPAAIPVLLATAGLCWHGRQVWTLARARPGGPPWRRWLGRVAFVVGVGYLALAVVILVGGGFSLSMGPVTLRVRRIAQKLGVAAVALVSLWLLSPRARAFVRGVPRSAVGFFVGASVAAFVLSLGPTITAMGHRIAGTAPYALFYHHVPGFDGLRVPARSGMLVMLFLAVLAGYGASDLDRRRRRGAAVVLTAGALFLVEATAAPIGLNEFSGPEGLMRPPRRIQTGARVPPVYQFLKTLPADAVIAEFPFGGGYQYELRYMYYSTEHWRRLVNGYSGYFPQSYLERLEPLRDLFDDLDRAWRTLLASGATHVVVHEGAYRWGEGQEVSAWLQQHDARQVVAFGLDKVFEIPRATRLRP